MPLFLRPNDFDEHERRDFSVILRDATGERVIGRIYSHHGPRLDKWLWAISGWGSRMADDFEQAKVKLKEQWNRLDKERT